VDLPGEADGKRRRLFEYRWPAGSPIGQGERNPTRRSAPFRFWIGFVRRRRIWRHFMAVGRCLRRGTARDAARQWRDPS
jgi:hypothetical protein